MQVCTPEMVEAPFTPSNLFPSQKKQKRAPTSVQGLCEQNTITRHIFLVIHNTFNVTLTLAQVQGVARMSSHVSSAWCCRCLDTFIHTPHHLSHLPPHFLDSSPSTSMCASSSLNHLCTPANEEQSDTFVDTAPLTVWLFAGQRHVDDAINTKNRARFPAYLLILFVYVLDSKPKWLFALSARLRPTPIAER